jgi:hypothetical protein
VPPARAGPCRLAGRHHRGPPTHRPSSPAPPETAPDTPARRPRPSHRATAESTSLRSSACRAAATAAPRTLLTHCLLGRGQPRGRPTYCPAGRCRGTDTAAPGGS